MTAVPHRQLRPRSTRARGLTLAAVCAVAAAPALAQQDPLDRLDGAQRKAVQTAMKRVEREQSNGSAQVDAAHVADLDGDGRPELVVLWTFLGPTYWWSRVTLYQPAGSAWREGKSVAVDGQPQGLAVKGSEVHVATLTLGPNDPRCCPSRKGVQRFRARGGELALVK